MPHGYKLQEMKGQKALVFGGLGFVGSNTVQKLVQLGATVTVFDAMLPGLGANKANVMEIVDKITVVKKDMRDFDAVCNAVKGQQFIFNCAGKSTHAQSMQMPFEDVQQNIVATLNVLEACRKFNLNAKIVFAGTRAELGAVGKLPADEQSLPHPLDIYSVNKWAASQYHLLYNRFYGLKACAIRVANCYGPRSQMHHHAYGVMNWFIRLALEGKTINVFGDGQFIRDYTFVDDAVDSLLLAAQSDKSNGKMYCIGSGRKIKFIDYVKKIIKIAGRGSFKLVEWPTEKKKIDIGSFYTDYSLIKKQLGWFPSTSLEDGLLKTIDFYRQRLPEYI